MSARVEFASLAHGAWADLASGAARPDAQQRAAGRAVAEACAGPGFIEAAGLGVEPEAVRGAFEAARALFALSAEQKAGLKQYPKRPEGPWDPLNYIGFQPAGTESLEKGRAFDARESFTVARSGLNDWHGVPPGVPEAAEKLFLQCTAAVRAVLVAAALGLGLDGAEAGFFVDRLQEWDMTLMRLIHYPAVAPGEAGSSDGQDASAPVRCGAHTDFGACTLLFTEGGDSGLQYRGAGGEWRDVHARPGNVLINTGDMLSVWTNGRWKPSPHRVVVPRGAQGRERFSIAFFCQPDSGVRMRPLQRLLSERSPAKWPSFSCGEYFSWRVKNVDVEEREDTSLHEGRLGRQAEPSAA